MKPSNIHVRIGHPAYRGANAPAYPTSKAHAVRILRDRGIKRDDARKAVNAAASGIGRHVCISVPFRFDVIEVSGYVPDSRYA